MAAADYFKNIFTEEHQNRPTFTTLPFKTLPRDHASQLTAPFSTEEIDNAVSSCASDKAPGPDGFNFRFIKFAWEIIKNDVYAIIRDFWETAKLPHGSNNAFIALIPKIEFPEEFKDFRPISMVGCWYKIITKLLARRMQSIMGLIISLSQSAFIRGRQILDGALVAAEIIDSCKKRKTLTTILKLDFNKAFDSVSWRFLIWVLSQMGFPQKWVDWVWSCISSATTSILINGSPSIPIKLQKGLRQGDSLSPFLFDVIVEVLHLIIVKATSMRLWEGIEANHGGQKVTHLQYADDVIMFCPSRLTFLKNIKKALILFHLASGLKVNFHKSSIMGLNVTDAWLNCAATELLCKKGSIPFSYLGLPIGGNSSRIKTWEPIIKRIEKKLASWHGKLLSIGGRLTLIKSSLSNLPLYFMSLYPIPQSIIARIKRIHRKFLWSGNLDKRFMPPIGWDHVQRPRCLGGLSVGNLLHRNWALLFKWIWRLFSEPDSLWSAVIRSKYNYPWHMTPSDLIIPNRGGPWKSICATIINNPPANQLATTGLRKKVGNGRKTLFWSDLWIAQQPLKSSFPRLFSIACHRQATVSSLGFWNGTSWTWAFSWTRELRVRDISERDRLQSLLENVCIALEDEDALIWSHCNSGQFSVKSFTAELAKIDQPQHHDYIAGNLWKGLVPPRVEIFVWLVCQGKLNTRAKLAKLQIINPSQDLCPLCNEKSESVDHLFIHCSFSWQVWSWWLSLWNVSWSPPATVKNIFEQWAIQGWDPFFKKVWWAAFYIIIWSIWKERNARIFNNISSSVEKTADLILLRLGWWIKGWGDPFPYNCDDIIRNPNCLRNCSLKLPRSFAANKTAISWAPPPNNHLKWNVDASFDPILLRDAVGGILRGSNGNFICLFSSPIPCMEINSVEVFAILRAIKISMSCDRLKKANIIIESDSKNAVQWCTEDSGGPWNLGFSLNFIRNARKAWLNITITHKGRESNMVADTLAKQGLSRADEFLAWC